MPDGMSVVEDAMVVDAIVVLPVNDVELGPEVAVADVGGVVVRLDVSLRVGLLELDPELELDVKVEQRLMTYLVLVTILTSSFWRLTGCGIETKLLQKAVAATGEAA